MPRKGVHVVLSAIVLLTAATVASAADAPAATPFAVKLPAGFFPKTYQSRLVKRVFPCQDFEMDKE